MCSLLFVAAPSQRKRIYVCTHIYGTLCIHVHYMYISYTFTSTFIFTSIYQSINQTTGSHHYLQFQSNTTEFILVCIHFHIYIFFSDSQKPGCHYSKYIYLLAQSCLCGINFLPCPPPSHKDVLLTLLRHNYSVGPSLLLEFPLMWIPFSSCWALIAQARPGQYHPCVEIPSPPQSSSDTWCQASKHSPYSS